AINTALQGALAEGGKMSAGMQTDFALLKTRLNDVRAKGKLLNVANLKVKAAPDMAQAVLNAEKAVRAEIDNLENKDKKDQLDKKKREAKEAADEVKAYVDLGLTCLKDVASAKVIWAPDVAIKVGANFAKTGAGMLIKEIYKDPGLDAEIEALGAKVRRTSGQIVYANKSSVAAFRSAFTTLASALREEVKVSNENLQEAMASFAEMAANIETKYKDAKGVDGKVAAVFTASRQHEEKVGPPAQGVREKIDNAPGGPNERKPGSNYGEEDIPAKMGRCYNDGRPDDPSSPAQKRPGSRIPGSAPEWEALTSGLTSLQARAQAAWNEDYKNEKMEKSLADDKANETDKEFREEDYVKGIAQYEKRKAEFNAWMASVGSLIAWINQAKAWYAENKPGETGKDSDIPWAVVWEQLNRKIAFISGPHMEPARTALQQVNQKIFHKALGDQKSKLTDMVF
ncbi:MAG TPA: hypothetical protein VML75_24450, partial [Kofleriaceae bacterium]|nr:hypothetical protein [Kofleriaceae bacterium]